MEYNIQKPLNHPRSPHHKQNNPSPKSFTIMDTIRTALQPVTQNLPVPVRDVGLNLLGDKCYKQLILDIDPASDPECVKLALSKGLGLGIVGASAIVKIPQLLKLLNSQSSAGISFLSYLLETAAYLITLAYNARMGNPFSTYGESALIAAQNVAIASLVLHYGGKSAGAAVFVAGLAAGVYALFNGDVVDMKTLSMLQAGAGVLGVASKLPQIVTIWQEGSTGQLSAFAVSLPFWTMRCMG
jgi:mannose-P-dolichol utilization defect protein 1